MLLPYNILDQLESNSSYQILNKIIYTATKHSEGEVYNTNIRKSGNIHDVASIRLSEAKYSDLTE
jgi:hypothetical protein